MVCVGKVFVFLYVLLVILFSNVYKVSYLYCIPSSIHDCYSFYGTMYVIVEYTPFFVYTVRVAYIGLVIYMYCSIVVIHCTTNG